MSWTSTGLHWSARAAVSKFVRRTLLIVISIATVRHAHAADDGWSQTIDGLQTRLILLTKKPRLGRPLYMRFELRNISDTRRHFRNGPVYRSDLLTAVQGNFDPVDSSISRPTSGGHQSVDPGETVTLWFRRNVADELQFQESGIYSIATRSIEGGEVVIGSNEKKTSIPLSNVPAVRKLTFRLGDGAVPEYRETERRLRRLVPNSWSVTTEGPGWVVFYPRGLVEAGEKAESENDQSALQAVQTEKNRSVSVLGHYDTKDLSLSEIESLPNDQRFERLGKSEIGDVYIHIRPRLTADWPQVIDVMRSLYGNTGPDAPKPLQVRQTGSISCWHDGSASALVLMPKSEDPVPAEQASDAAISRVMQPESKSESHADLVRWDGDRPDTVLVGTERFNLSDGRVFEVDGVDHVVQVPLNRPPIVTAENGPAFLDQVAAVKARSFLSRLKEDIEDSTHLQIDKADSPAGRVFDEVMKQFDHAFPMDARVRPNLSLRDFFESDPIQRRMMSTLHSLIGSRSSGPAHYDRAIRIIRELGRPQNLQEVGWCFASHASSSPFKVLALDASELKLRLRPESKAFQFLEAARTAARRGSKPAPLPNILGKLDFLHRLVTEPDYRPEGWERRLARCMPDGMQNSQLITLCALESVPLPLPVPAELGNSSSFDELLPRICYVARGHLSPRPQEQIAALRLAARTKSSWFLPHIHEALKSKNAGVRIAATVAMKACSKPKWPALPENKKPPSLDTTQIDDTLKRIHAAKVELVSDRDVQQLHELTQLDYGNNAAAWIAWWNEEKYSRRIALENRRPILISGTVMDGRGQVLPDATVTLSLQRNFVYGVCVTARVKTDRQGRYVLRSGLTKDMADPARENSVDVVPGWLFVDKPGYFVSEMSRPQRLYFSEFNSADDPILQVPASQMLRTDKPLSVDIQLSRAVQVTVHIEDMQGQPFNAAGVLANWNASDVNQNFPSEGCYCCGEYSAWPAIRRGVNGMEDRLVCDLEKRPGGMFQYQRFRPGVSRAFTVLADRPKDPQVKRPDPHGTTPTVDFAQPGRYLVRLRFNASEVPGRRIAFLGSRMLKSTPVGGEFRN